MNQRKQQLEHNELADALGDQIEKLKPYIWKVGIAVGVVAAVCIGVYWYLSRIHAAQVDSWSSYTLTTQVVEINGLPERLESVWKNNEPPAAFWALLKAGEFELIQGNEAYRSDFGKAKSSLNSAKEKFEQVLADADADEVMLRRRALYLLGYAHESLGEFDQAKEKYEEFLEDNEGTPWEPLVREALFRVSDPATIAMFQKFLDWEPATGPGAADLLGKRPDISFSEDLLTEDPNKLNDGGSFNPGNSNKQNEDKPDSNQGEIKKPDSTPPTDLNPPSKKGDSNNSEKTNDGNSENK